MTAKIEIVFEDQSKYSRDFDDYLAHKSWFSDEESKELVDNAMPMITKAIQLGYQSGKLKIPASNVNRPYHGSWTLTIKSDEE